MTKTSVAHTKKISASGFEVLLVLGILTALMVALRLLSKVDWLAGQVPVLLGVILILLPMRALDRTDRAYARYGLKMAFSWTDLLWTAGVCVVTFVPVAGFVLLFPQVWGDIPSWRPVIPDGYLQIAAAHLLLVAIPEEFFYRGYLLGRLDDLFARRWRVFGVKVGVGLLLSSAVFAMGHYIMVPLPSRFLVFFPALLFGWLRLKRGCVVTPILYHACCNIFMDLFRAGFGL